MRASGQVAHGWAISGRRSKPVTALVESEENTMQPQRHLAGINMEGLTSHLAPFETRKPEFGGALGRA